MYSELFKDLRARPQPWQLAEKLRSWDALGLTDEEKAKLPAVPYWGRTFGSSMGEKFAEAQPLDKQLAVLATLTHEPAPAGNDPDAIRAYLHGQRVELGMVEGKTSFKTDRLNRQQRRDAKISPGMSRRRYDKLFRLVGRLEQYVGEFDEQAELADLARFAKVGFGADVPLELFRKSPATAAFIAYYVSNLGRRSLFIAGPQARALDTAAQALFRKAEREPKTSWLAIAHILPREDVLARLSVEERVWLLEKATKILERTSELLAKSAATIEDKDLSEMVVRRGNDSSTWNALAGSWNKARDLWIAVSWSTDPQIVASYNPGKVMRLMAVDVVRWHRSVNGIDPDTRVWALLPRPWAVFRGEATCTRAEVEAACREIGIDPEQTGWTKPRPRTAIDIVREHVEAVHGVVVGHPALAGILRKAGYFSGHGGRSFKGAIPGIEVERNELGFAVGVGVDS